MAIRGFGNQVFNFSSRQTQEKWNPVKKEDGEDKKSEVRIPVKNYTYTNHSENSKKGNTDLMEWLDNYAETFLPGRKPLKPYYETSISKDKLESFNGYSADKLRELGFSDADIEKYFVSTAINGKLADGTEMVLNEGNYVLKNNLVVNGINVKTIDELKNALTYGLVDLLFKEVSAGKMNLEDVIAKLEEMGVTNLEVERNEETQRALLKYSYLGEQIQWYVPLN